MANIKTHLNNIKNALFGNEVRGSIHDGIDAINKEVESTTGRQEHLETTFDQLTINAGNSNAEIVDARVKADGTSYKKLGDRLDSVDSQLEHKANKVLDIENLKRLDLKVGDVVFIENYYSYVKNNSHHFRIIEETDKGFGIQLNNGKYANLIYEGEVNITHIGAFNSNEHGIICDIKPYIDAILKINPTPIIKIPNGYWGISENNFKKNGMQIKGVSTQPEYSFTNVKVKNSTVLFPIDVNQKATLSIGHIDYETRAIIIEGLDITTHNYEYVNGVLKCLDTGSEIGLDLICVSFSKIRDLVIYGINENLLKGISFNGFECYFRDIMFRGFGKLGSSTEYAFYTYGRTSPFYAIPSGLRYENISFEGVGCSWFKLIGSDVHLTGINGEIGYLNMKDGVTSKNASELSPNYKTKGIICVDDETLGVIVDSVSIQNMGYSYTDGITDYSFDSLVLSETLWGNHCQVSISNVVLQSTKKNIYGFSCVNSQGNTNSNGDFSNKSSIVVNNISCDNGNVIRYKLKDNNGLIRDNDREVMNKNGFACSDTFKRFTNRKLLPKDSNLQHCVAFDNDKQIEYMGYVKTSYVGYEKCFGIFYTNDILPKGYNIFTVDHFSVNGDIDLHIKLDFADGTNTICQKYLPQSSGNSIITTSFDLYMSESKKLAKVTLINNNNKTSGRIYSISHSFKNSIECNERIRMREGMILGNPSNVDLDSLFTNGNADNRLFKVGFMSSTSPGNPSPSHCIVLSFDGGSVLSSDCGFQMLMPIDGSASLYFRNGSKVWKKVDGVSV
jgi:hypothetical protein|nr:hypothetical protein [uncultured Romboutsia sp.]DAE87488.1 MAG TPA: Minor structural protein adsorption, WTA interaction, caudovirales.2A [Caudoviricetes sp.]